MNPARWQHIVRIFHDALERDAATRDTFLREATAGDPDLLREVQTLLSHEGVGFLNQPAWTVAADPLFDEDDGSLVGKTLGNPVRYRVLNEIGRGGMGVVYAAKEKHLGRIVALKALTPEYTRDPVRRERLIREARAAAALSHPAINTVYALEEIDGELYIASELLRGRTLREELRNGPLPSARLLPDLITIATALEAAHARDIVHRDVKPENIMRRDDDGQIKVLDFGLARSPARSNAGGATRLTEPGSAPGTPGYMAPEQLHGVSDERADVFAFGVLACELATGENPFGNDWRAMVLELIDGQRPGLLCALPLPGLDRIVQRCMRANPTERYATAKFLVADLRTLGIPPLSQPPPPLPLPAPTPTPAPPHHDAVWWWQVHQNVVAIVNAAVPAVILAVRHWIVRPYGPAMFLLALAVAAISITLRLNLSFTARVHPALLIDHRARLFPAVAVADALLATALLVTAAFIAAEHDGIAAIIVSLAVVMLASLSLIEPTTTRAAGLTPRDDT